MAGGFARPGAQRDDELFRRDEAREGKDGEVRARESFRVHAGEEGATHTSARRGFGGGRFEIAAWRRRERRCAHQRGQRTVWRERSELRELPPVSQQGRER